MDTNKLKFEEGARAALAERLTSDAFKVFVDNTKAASDTGSFEMVITTDDIDRMGEMIKIDGWDNTYYMKSPVVLWGHNYSLMPVGITDTLRVEGNKVIAKGRFAPTEMGQTLRKLYDLGMLKASSVGFMVLEQEGNIITKAQLLEWSFVSVPANPYALSLRELDVIRSEEVAGMVVKSISEKIKTRDTVQAPAEAAATEGEKPKEETPAAATEAEGEKSKKGAVQDELTAEEKMKAKYKNANLVWNVMYALCDVYFEEETPVEDFTKLLTETISILQTIADGTYSAPTEGKSVAGRISKSKHIALESVLKQAKELEEGLEGDVDDEEDEEETEDTKAAKAVLDSRKILQDVATIMGSALSELRKTSKELISK